MYWKWKDGRLTFIYLNSMIEQVHYNENNEKTLIIPIIKLWYRLKTVYHMVCSTCLTKTLLKFICEK